MFSFIVVIVCVLVEANAYMFLVYSLFCFVVGDQIIKRRRLGFHYPMFHLHICVPVLCQDLDFQRHMSWSFCFVFTELRRDVVVRCVDIGGIPDHHCSDFFL